MCGQCVSCACMYVPRVMCIPMGDLTAAVRETEGNVSGVSDSQLLSDSVYSLIIITTLSTFNA